MRELKFYEHGFTPQGINYTFNGVDINDPLANSEFDDYIRGNSFLRKVEYADKLKTILISAANRGQADSYRFLTQMSDDDAWDWVDTALMYARKLYRHDPEAHAPRGIIATLDEVRRQRKAERAAKKAQREEAAQ